MRDISTKSKNLALYYIVWEKGEIIIYLNEGFMFEPFGVDTVVL